jgi:hypothetical protein
LVALAWPLAIGVCCSNRVANRAAVTTGASAGTGAVGDAATGSNSDSAGQTGSGPTPAQLLALVQAHPCTSANMVSKHAYPDPGSAVPDVPICGLKGAVYFYSDMDIDCDGRPVAGCPGPDPSYYADTAFHNNAAMPLAAAITPYVVIPSDFTYAGLDTVNGGNVVAVLYNGKLTYSVFGDTGPTNLIGEASYACAQSLGINPNPATGGVNAGVTYIVFVGANTAPTDIEDQTETRTLGEKLATALLANN